MSTRARRRGRARVLINCAASLDGKIAYADGSRASLSGPEDLRRVHRMRNSVDAILVGIGTVMADDPSLAVRPEFARPRRRAPTKIVLDSSCRTPAGARLLSSPGRAVVVTAEGCAGSVQGAEMVRCGGGRVDLARLLALLPGRGIESVMVEGGGTVIRSFLAAGLWDRMTVYYAPLVIGGGTTPTIADGDGATGPGGIVGARITASRGLGDGLLVTFRPLRRRGSGR
jgi:2,5-diamino-6-(ribosylamino)-4(3H)-pyrimidinone 5'-phosphate reductase